MMSYVRATREGQRRWSPHGDTLKSTRKSRVLRAAVRSPLKWTDGDWTK